MIISLAFASIDFGKVTVKRPFSSLHSTFSKSTPFKEKALLKLDLLFLAVIKTDLF